MIETVLATVGCVCGVLGFLFGATSLIWQIGVSRSTHRIEYTPLPVDPFSVSNISEPSEEPEDDNEDDPGPSAPKSERDAAKAPKVLTSFSEIYGEIE